MNNNNLNMRTSLGKDDYLIRGASWQDFSISEIEEELQDSTSYTLSIEHKNKEERQDSSDE